MERAPVPVTSALKAPLEVVIAPVRFMLLSDNNVTSPPPLESDPEPSVRRVPASMSTAPPLEVIASVMSTPPRPMIWMSLFCAVIVPPALPVMLTPPKVTPPPPETAALRVSVGAFRSTVPVVLVMERETMALVPKAPLMLPPAAPMVPVPAWVKFWPPRVTPPAPVVETAALTARSPAVTPSELATTCTLPPLPMTAPPTVTLPPARRLAPPVPEVTAPPRVRLCAALRDSRRTAAVPTPPEASTSEPAVVESSPLKVVMSTAPPAVVMSFWMARAPAPVTSALNAPPPVVKGPDKVMVLTEASVITPISLEIKPVPRSRVVPAPMVMSPPLESMAPMRSTRPVPVTRMSLFWAVTVPLPLPVMSPPPRVTPPPPEMAASKFRVGALSPTDPVVLVMARLTVASPVKVPVMLPPAAPMVPVPDWVKPTPPKVTAPVPVVETAAFTARLPRTPLSELATICSAPPPAFTAAPMVTLPPARRLTPPEPEVTPALTVRLCEPASDSRRMPPVPAPPEASMVDPAVLESSPLAVVISTMPPAVVMSFWIESPPTPVTSASNVPLDVVTGPNNCMLFTEASAMEPPPLESAPAPEPRSRVVAALTVMPPPFEVMEPMMSTAPTVPSMSIRLFCAVMFAVGLPMTDAPLMVTPPSPLTDAFRVTSPAPLLSKSPMRLTMPVPVIGWLTVIPLFARTVVPNRDSVPPT